MFDRLLLTLGIILVGWLLYRGATWALLRRRARDVLGLARYRPGRPAILYFTAPGCAPCRTIQRPALEELVRDYGGRLQVLRVDATEEPAMADHWGVLSVPTTFVIDSKGRPRGVNHGVARARRLREQLAAIGEPAPPPAKQTEAQPHYVDG